MPLKKSQGNMYPWVTHTHAHLRGSCSHQCSYCYAADAEKKNPSGKWTGPLRVDESEFAVRYGSGKTIFVEHMNDLFAKDVPDPIINRIIGHCLDWKDNTYVLQTKNPMRYAEVFKLPERVILGTTIETNIEDPEQKQSKAPSRIERMQAMEKLPAGIRKFVTIEPVLDFDVDVLAEWIARIRPEFLNLGADSKGHNLIEPSVEKVMKLVDKLHEYGIDLREKHNLQRLKKT